MANRFEDRQSDTARRRTPSHQAAPSFSVAPLLILPFGAQGPRYPAFLPVAPSSPPTSNIQHPTSSFVPTPDAYSLLLRVVVPDLDLLVERGRHLRSKVRSVEKGEEAGPPPIGGGNDLYAHDCANWRERRLRWKNRRPYLGLGKVEDGCTSPRRGRGAGIYGIEDGPIRQSTTYTTYTTHLLKPIATSSILVPTPVLPSSFIPEDLTTPSVILACTSTYSSSYDPTASSGSGSAPSHELDLTCSPVSRSRRCRTSLRCKSKRDRRVGRGRGGGGPGERESVDGDFAGERLHGFRLVQAQVGWDGESCLRWWNGCKRGAIEERAEGSNVNFMDRGCSGSTRSFRQSSRHRLFLHPLSRVPSFFRSPRIQSPPSLHHHLRIYSGIKSSRLSLSSWEVLPS